MELHRLLGHISPETAKRMVAQGAIRGIELDRSAAEFCRPCTHAKQQCKAIPDKRTTGRAENYGDLVHTDSWGAAQVNSLRGKKYFMTLTDDFSREVHVYFLKLKAEAFKTYWDFVAWLGMQRRSRNGQGARVKTLQSDRGGEFLVQKFSSFLKELGTARWLTTHDMPQQNGVAEQMNCTLIEHACAMIFTAGLPGSLWAEAIAHAAWLHNRTVSRSLPEGKTPLKMATGMIPDLSDLHEWGCTAYVLNPSGSKLDSKVGKGRFDGFDRESKGYRVYWPAASTVSVKRNVTFNRDEILSSGDVQVEGVDWDIAPNISEMQPKQNQNQNAAITTQNPPKIEPQIPPSAPQNAPVQPPPAPTQKRNWHAPPANFKSYGTRSKMKGAATVTLAEIWDKDDGDI